MAIVLLILISFIFYTTIPIKTTKTLLVPQGSVSNIITQLTKRGYMLSAIDKYMLVLMGKPQSGWIAIKHTDLNRIDFLHALVTGKAQMKKITLIPGETTILFLEEIASQLRLDVAKLEESLSSLSLYQEAGIYADTYSVPYGINEENVIKFLTLQSNKKYKTLSQNIYRNYDIKRWNRTLTIASIIQKEAANNQEMSLVSSVIFNRLKKGMPLQMDGTLNYGKYSHVKVTPKRIREDQSRFNTYKHKGLPPHPICSVSLAAIKAAVKPATTDYLYFMKNTKGVHDFSSSYTKHRKNIKRAKRKTKPVSLSDFAD